MLAIREHRFPFLPKVGDWNRFNRNTGGTLVEKCCHFFDLMRHILRDEPVRVFASGAQNVNHLDERYDGEVPDIIDNAFVIVDFAGGARAVLDLCMFAEGSEEQEEISAVGPIGKLEVKLPSGNVIWSPRDKSGPHVEHVPVPEAALEAGSHEGATYFQLASFHAALVSGSKPAIQCARWLSQCCHGRSRAGKHCKRRTGGYPLRRLGEMMLETMPRNGFGLWKIPPRGHSRERGRSRARWLSPF